MNIDNLLAQAFHETRSPLIEMIAQIIRSQAEQIQRQAEQIQRQAEQIVVLQKTIDELKDEISRLTKTPKRPKFREGGMEPRDRSRKPPPNESTPNVGYVGASKKHEEVRVVAIGVPENSRFKGYQEFSVEDVEITAKTTTYKLEVWIAPDGAVVRAKLPQELKGKHFGATLRTLVLNLYVQGMTQPGIIEFLEGIGVEISSGQVNNILVDEGDAFSEVSEEILRVGLKEAPYVRTDDTGERHKKKNAYCTHIGGEYFAYYTTALSKSRANFLRILLQGKEGYYINDAMIWHLFQSGVEDDVLNLFETHKGKQYTSKKGVRCLMNSLGLVGKKQRIQCLEAALVGFISETILKVDQVLVSDRAGQFAVFNHAACWVHMERPLRKIPASCIDIERQLKEVRHAIWTLYSSLKTAALTQTGKEAVIEQYDALTSMTNTSPAITRVLQSFKEYRAEMLKALDYPGLPLHNNDSERDIRRVVKRRLVSSGTKSDSGRKLRDGLASIKQTCFRLKISFWEYTLSWFQRKPPDLAELVRTRYQENPSNSSVAPCSP